MSFLDGIRITTTAQNVPGPLAVARMTQAGALVTKIEPPTGDPLLVVAPAWHAELHVGVAIERLDLKSEVGRARAAELMRDADLLITSQRPSQLARLSLAPESLRPSLPKLRFLRIVGSVREPERPGHDLTYQAESGLLGEAMPRSLFADIMGSERVFAGALALLRQQPGSALDVGLVESLEPLLAPLHHGLTLPNGPLGGAAPQYRIYAAKSGRVAVAALEPHFEARLYEELQCPLRSDLASRLLERSASEWDSWARERGLPLVAVNDSDRAAAS